MTMRTKCVPQLLLQTPRSAIGKLFPVPSNCPRSLCEASFSFLKRRVVEHKRRPKGISKIQNGGQKIGKYVKVEL